MFWFGLMAGELNRIAPAAAASAERVAAERVTAEREGCRAIGASHISAGTIATGQTKAGQLAVIRCREGKPTAAASRRAARFPRASSLCADHPALPL